MKIGNPDETKVVQVSKKSQALRTAIPLIVRENLSLTSDDKLVWQVYLEENKMKVEITKKE